LDPQDVREVIQLKALLRRRFRARRLRWRGLSRRHANRAVTERLMSAIAPSVDAAVAGFWPLAEEFDTRPLLHALAARGHSICLPVVVGPGRPLEFRQWRPGDELQAGSFGVLAPIVTMPQIIPNIVVTPLLAADRRGHRLGYGGGYYDRSLATLRSSSGVTAVGIGYDFQYCHRIPQNRDDEPLDWLVTDRHVYEFKNGGATRRRGRGII
jgi:5-formyltetrahydrofolate cyclo-ligase